MNQDAPAPPRKSLHFVCTGKARAKGRKGELCWVFRLVLANGKAGPERVYDQKNLKSIRVGHVYEIDVDPDNDTQIYVNTARWLRIWDDAEEAAVWQTASAAFDTLEIARKHENQQTSRRLPVEVLEPIRKEYWRTNSAGRLAIEVRVLAYLRLTSLSSE